MLPRRLDRMRFEIRGQGYTIHDRIASQVRRHSVSGMRSRISLWPIRTNPFFSEPSAAGRSSLSPDRKQDRSPTNRSTLSLSMAMQRSFLLVIPVSLVPSLFYQLPKGESSGLPYDPFKNLVIPRLSGGSAQQAKMDKTWPRSGKSRRDEDQVSCCTSNLVPKTTTLHPQPPSRKTKLHRTSPTLLRAIPTTIIVANLTNRALLPPVSRSTRAELLRTTLPGFPTISTAFITILLSYRILRRPTLWALLRRTDVKCLGTRLPGLSEVATAFIAVVLV